jgi:hypothetical protein
VTGWSGLPRTKERTSLALAIAVALPICAATAAVAAFTVSELVGRPLWSHEPARNLAEAAALGSVSDVVRRLAVGEDPTRLVPVRPHVISSSVTRVTGLEAAVWRRSAELMRLLDRAGAIADEPTRRHLTCLASDLRVEEIVEYFSPGGPPSCVSDEAVNQILARSHEP